MTDQFGRTINYMRISLTDRCNLRCCYCMPEGSTTESDFLPSAKLLTVPELLRLCKITASLGISRYKITGGEPLVRREALPFIRELFSMPGVEDVTLTTNGVLLAPLLPSLFEAGMRSINISLDTTDRERYAAITGKDVLPAVLEAIDTACQMGFSVKLNAVAQENYAPGELEALLSLITHKNICLRFITRMDLGSCTDWTDSAGSGGFTDSSSASSIRNRIADCGFCLTPDEKKHGNGPATYYRIEGMNGILGFIDPMHETFCSSCNRIRLTAEGLLKPCLYYKPVLDLSALLRSSTDDTRIRELLSEAIYHKPSCHHFREQDNTLKECRPMGRIGG